MRNGNIYISTVIVRGPLGSYRTYEEWKPCIMLFRFLIHFSSYRTYEEWKLASGNTFLNSSFIVLTVPMRNGNPDNLHNT